MAYYYDVSPDFNLDGKGNLVVLEDTEAVDQALQNFINLSLGELIYFPNNAGFTEGLLFKNITEDSLSTYKFSLSNLLRYSFAPAVSVLDLEVESEGGLLNFNLIYRIEATGEISELTLVKKEPEPKPEPFILQDVDYVDTNLENFVLQQLENPEMEKYKLILNGETNKWEWGRFVLTNFSQASANFALILSWINT